MSTHGSFGNDEVLLVGDSNGFFGLKTDGTAGFDGAIDTTNSRCLEFRNLQHPGLISTVVCLDPLQYNFVPIPGAIGCGLTFMRDYYLPTRLASNRNVRITASAVGGTALVANDYWAVGGSGGPEEAVARFNQAVAQDSRNTPVVIIWNTGANDAIHGVSQSDYQTAFANTISYFRSNITGGTNIPILVVGLVPAWVATNTGTFGPVDAALKAIPANNSKCGYVDMANLDGLGTAAAGQTDVPYHLNAATQRLVGNPGLGRAWSNLSA